MKKYRLNVNGYAYEVEIEEVLADEGQQLAPMVSAPVAPAAPVAHLAASAPQQAKQVTNSPAATGESISAPMQGKIIDVPIVVGDKVVPGQVIAILEAMKMENEIVASSEGTVASIGVSAGQSVEAGDLLVALG